MPGSFAHEASASSRCRMSSPLRALPSSGRSRVRVTTASWRSRRNMRSSLSVGWCGAPNLVVERLGVVAPAAAGVRDPEDFRHGGGMLCRRAVCPQPRSPSSRPSQGLANVHEAALLRSPGRREADVGQVCGLLDPGPDAPYLRYDEG